MKRCLALVLYAAVGSATASAQHVALVVGSNVGDGPEVALRYAVSDAQRVRDVLRDAARANVVLLEEPTVVALEASLRELATHVARGGGENRSTVTFYYAGHADESDLHLSGEHYPVSRLAERLEATGARATVAVIDACRSDGGVSRRGLTRVEGPDTTIVVPESPEGVVWIRSTAHGESAQESDSLGGGVFTHFWVSALRGAGDRNSDGLVSLSEAFEFTASRTSGYSATTTAQVQEPAYDYQLSGSRDLILTITGQAPGVVTLPAEAGAAYVIRSLPSGAVVLSVEARPEESVRVALPAGRFQVLRRIGERISATTINLPWGGRYEVQRSELADIGAVERMVARGLPGPPSALFAGLVAGVGLEEAAPLIWQRAHGVFLWNLAAPFQHWALRAGLGWEGYDFDLDPPSAEVRSDVIAATAGVEWVAPLGAALLTLGPRVHAAVVLQRERRVPADRFEAAGLDPTQTRRGFRIGLGTGLELHVPLSGAVGWLVSLEGGVLLEPDGDAGLATRWTGSLDTGPGFWW